MQVALIVIMAHVGCFVTAEYATMPAIDKVFTRITTEVSPSLSRSLPNWPFPQTLKPAPETNLTASTNWNNIIMPAINEVFTGITT